MILELVRFATRDGVTDEEFYRACRGVDAYLAGCPGFRSRQVYRIDRDRWADLVWWDDLDAARNAAAHIGEDARCADFLGILAPETVDLVHGTIGHEHP